MTLEDLKKLLAELIESDDGNPITEAIEEQDKLIKYGYARMN